MLSLQNLQWSRSRVISVAAICIVLLLIALRSGYSDQPVTRFGSFSSQPSTWKAVSGVGNKTLGFERILAINLPERSDHRDALTLAAALSDVHVVFIDGVNGASVPQKVLPLDHDPNHLPGVIGSWRAHINAIRQVVDDDLSSALVVEDDVDWDVRMKDLLQDFAVSSTAVLEHRDPQVLQFDELPKTTKSSSSPYGDGWDVLWLGHCGMEINVDQSRVIHQDDVSVPQTQYLESWDPKATSPMTTYPNHTRLTGVLKEGVCSLAYAVTQKAARAILFNIGMEHLDLPFDLMLRRFCLQATCIGVLPQLFDHHRVKGSLALDSEINKHEGPDRTVAKTNNIRWSVRMNMKKLLKGETEYDDQFPDVEDRYRPCIVLQMAEHEEQHNTNLSPGNEYPWE